MITLLRHFLAIIVLLGLIFLFALNSNQESYTVHYWNRNIADASFVLLCLTLSLGPVTKLIPKTRFLLPWRRELGIAFAVSATMHVVIYADFYRWDVLRFFARIEEGQEAKWLDNAFAIGNWIGLLALLYAVVLALTSNDIAQRALGRGWKFLQQQSYTLFVLVVLHIAILIYLVTNGREAFFSPVFITMAAVTLLLQTVGYLYTVGRQMLRRRRRPQARQS